MDISVVIPLYNEEESLRELHDWIQRVMTEHNFTYEIIFVNDGSTDGSWNVIEELSKKNPCVKGIKFRRNYGKSPPSIAVSRPPREMSLSPWMPTSRTLPTRSPSSTV